MYTVAQLLSLDGGMADTGDLKSPGSNTVRVRLPLRASLMFNKLRLSLDM